MFNKAAREKKITYTLDDGTIVVKEIDGIALLLKEHTPFVN
jgi:hypothetical protein